MWACIPPQLRSSWRSLAIFKQIRRVFAHRLEEGTRGQSRVVPDFAEVCFVLLGRIACDCSTGHAKARESTMGASGFAAVLVSPPRTLDVGQNQHGDPPMQRISAQS